MNLAVCTGQMIISSLFVLSRKYPSLFFRSISIPSYKGNNHSQRAHIKIINVPESTGMSYQ